MHVMFIKFFHKNIYYVISFGVRNVYTMCSSRNAIVDFHVDLPLEHLYFAQQCFRYFDKRKRERRIRITMLYFYLRRSIYHFARKTCELRMIILITIIMFT